MKKGKDLTFEFQVGEKVDVANHVTGRINQV